MAVAGETLWRVYVLNGEKVSYEDHDTNGFPGDHMRICSPLVKIGPNVHNKDHDKNDNPTDKGAHAPSVPFLIEDDISDKEGTKDLSGPVDEIV